MGDMGRQGARDQPERMDSRQSPSPREAALTLEGDDVGRDVSQLQQDARQGGVKHVQAMLGVPGLLQQEGQCAWG